MADQLEAILEQIKKYNKIIIHRHQRPDPDAIGSQIGLAEILKASFPYKQIYVVGKDIPGLDWIGQMDEIDGQTFDGALVIVTDTANAPRIDDRRFDNGDKLIKIDHHPNDEPYGDLMWVEPEASSCSEMIYSFYQHFAKELKMPKKAASALYAGIIGDTGRFAAGVIRIRGTFKQAADSPIPGYRIKRRVVPLHFIKYDALHGKGTVRVKLKAASFL